MALISIPKGSTRWSPQYTQKRSLEIKGGEENRKKEVLTGKERKQSDAGRRQERPKGKLNKAK